jgi:hypothetical protein
MRIEPQVEGLRPTQRRNSVTLVPGTWAHGWWNVVIRTRLPKWLGGSGQFSDKDQWFDIESTILNAIGAQDLNVYVLRWTERNSVSDRRKAAAVLASHLVNSLESAPEAKHHVLAHSHGGNIAAMAFRQMESISNLQNIHFASMGTPFIWFQNREISTAVKVSYGMFMFLWVFLSIGFGELAAMLFMLVLDSTLPSHLPLFSERTWYYIAMTGKWIIGIGVFLGSMSLFSVVEKIENGMPSALSDAEQTASSTTLMGLGSVLILRAPTDEASLTLSIVVLGMFLNRVVGSIISKPWKFFWSVVGTGVTIIGFVMLVVIFVQWTGYHYEPSSFVSALLGGVLRAALLFAAIGPALIAIYVFLAILGAAALGILGYNFGEAIILTFGTEVHVEVIPAKGPWPVFCASEHMNYLHHKVYISKEAQDELLLWLKGESRANNCFRGASMTSFNASEGSEALIEEAESQTAEIKRKLIQ